MALFVWILMRSIASDGNFVEPSELGVSGREFIDCCTETILKKLIETFVDWKCKKMLLIETNCEPSFLLDDSGVDLLPGTIKRLMLETRSRNDNAGLGGATGRCGKVYWIKGWKNCFISCDWVWVNGMFSMSYIIFAWKHWCHSGFFASWRWHWKWIITFWWQRWLYLWLTNNCLHHMNQYFNFDEMRMLLRHTFLTFLMCVFRLGWRWNISSHDEQNSCWLHWSHFTFADIDPHRSHLIPSRDLPSKNIFFFLIFFLLLVRG